MPDRATVRDIYLDAADLPEDQRAAFLDRRCGGDAALRAEVESLLAAAAGRPGFLSSPTASPAGPEGSWESPGTTIGPYRLLEEIGRGGFGAVYMAEQERPVRRRVALKIIKLGMDTRAVIARFEAERQALALMDHANIARVFDAGATESGRPYFVMELVRGEPITAYCDRHNLSIRDRVGLFMQVCHAVQHAHQKGVIHRDLKPGNILVATEDGRPHAKIIDFGIAKATDQRLTERTVFTEFRQFIGTPEYMSPEQAEGSLNVDTRSDVYSLGVLLYELLTGATPFDASTLRAAAYAELQRIIREEEPAKPSTRLLEPGSRAAVATRRGTEPARLSAMVRGDLDWIVMRALEKDRVRRYDTASALAADLSRHLAGEPVVAAPPGAAYRVRKFVGRHRWGVTAGALIAATLVLGIAGTSIGLVQAGVAREAAVNSATQAGVNAERAGREAARADAQAAEARASARVAGAVNDLLTSMIGRADRAKEQGRTDVTVREVMDAAAADLEAGVSTPEPRVAAMLAKAIGQTYAQLNLLEPAERMLRLHHRLAGEHFGDRSLEHALSAAVLGDLLRKRGSVPEARELYSRAAAISEGHGEEGVHAAAAAVLGNAALDATLGQSARAEADLRGLLDSLGRRGLGGSTHAIAATNALATMLWASGRRGEAQEVYARSLELLREQGREPDRAHMLNSLAAIQHAQRDYAGAEQTSAEEVALVRRLYGDRHLTLAYALDSYSMILMAREKTAEAAAAGREMVAIKRALLKPGHQSLATSLRKLGSVLIDAEEFAEAELILREACGALAELMPAGEGDFLFARYQHAVALWRLARPAEAEAVLRRVMDDSAVTLPEGSRLWWVRGASACLLAGVVADQAGTSAAQAEQRGRIAEAEALIAAYADRLAAHKQGMGPRARRHVVGRSLDRVVDACDTATRLAPSDERTAAAAAWRAKRDRFAAEPAEGP